MTDKQPEALRLADGLEKIYGLKAEAMEMRRLHEVNAELVEALRVVVRGVPDTWDGVKQAKEAIAKSQGKNNG